MTLALAVNTCAAHTCSHPGHETELMARKQTVGLQTSHSSTSVWSIGRTHTKLYGFPQVSQRLFREQKYQISKVPEFTARFPSGHSISLAILQLFTVARRKGTHVPLPGEREGMVAISIAAFLLVRTNSEISEGQPVALSVHQGLIGGFRTPVPFICPHQRLKPECSQTQVVPRNALATRDLAFLRKKYPPEV